MTRYLLDTNIVSEAQKLRPSPLVAGWMAEQADADLFISAVTLAELRRGVLKKADGRARRELEAWFLGPTGPQSLFAGRILAFGVEAALLWAELMNAGDGPGRSRSPLDMVIAATALANGCVVATANEKHFEGIAPMINPMRPGA